MPLNNFGSILGFAEDIETQNMNFFSLVATNPACDDALFSDLAKSAKKRISEIQRVKRENVTEMVLEAVEGFHRDPFVVDVEDDLTLTKEQASEQSQQLLDRSQSYYEQAAIKLKGQADVARALKVLAKKIKKEQMKLAEC